MSPTIVVVDDDIEILELYELYFTLNGFRVLTADSAREALRICADIRPDLLLSDVRMPEMDGFDLVRALRERGDTYPICMHTAYDTLEAVRTARELDIQDIIFKPSPPAVVLAKVRMAISEVSVCAA